jgi:hypothetical protein
MSVPWWGVVLAREGVFDVTPGGRGNAGRKAFAAWLTLSALACAASAQTSDRRLPATPAAGSRVEATLSANGLEIRRSVSQPPRRFSGERMELKSSADHAAREKFYGVVMILKYRVRQAAPARSMTFTEKVYLVEETHDFGLWKFYERSWSPDEHGVWTDVLSLGDDTPLPADYRRVLRQELYCDGKLFANSLITFTPEAIEFRTLRLGATRPGVAEEDIRGGRQSRT